MNRLATLFFVMSVVLTGCIGDDIIDDFVEPTLRIVSKVDSLTLGDSYQFEAMYTNNVGMAESVDLNWISSDPNILAVDNNGWATGVGEGQVSVQVTSQVEDRQLVDAFSVVVVNQEVDNSLALVRSGEIQTTSSYVLRGSFELREEGDNLVLSFKDDYVASRGLPGLYVYLTNNPTTTNGAYEIGKVSTFDGAHSYTIPMSDATLNQYSHLLYFCKPFVVKVGDGAIEN